MRMALPTSPFALTSSDLIALQGWLRMRLSSAVFTRDMARGLSFARGIVAGMTHIKDITVDDQSNVPFGGEKNSGLGRFNGHYALDEFTRAHWVTWQAGGGHHYPF
jgi:aldehyde dehydrogenase (NAD+)